jgi:hypothetical protein
MSHSQKFPFQCFQFPKMQKEGAVSYSHGVMLPVDEKMLRLR